MLHFQLCNRSRFNVPLAEGYRYKGIISLSGGVCSKEGKPDYKEAVSAPTLLLHGIEDRIVNYKKIQFGRVGFFGASTLVKRLKKYECNYQIMRYKDCGHEVAGSFIGTLTQQTNFMEENISEGLRKIIDATLEDPGIDSRFRIRTFKDVGGITLSGLKF